MKKLFVRCVDRTVFEIDPETLEPLGPSCYDAYCYTDPRRDVNYIEHMEWTNLQSEQWDKMFNVRRERI